MTRVFLDAATLAKLQNVTAPLEVCNEAGQVLGRLIPTVDLAQYEPWEPPISEEELQRREQGNEKRYTTAEVLAYLEKL
jgi:hypothetical protein